ncbi:hypothetical protein MBLNU459_g4223t1 [Dothideomycetes sp. NU459]
MAGNQDISPSILAHLRSQGLAPTATWLDSFTSTARTGLPLASLQKTAVFRLLASDLTTSLQTTSSNTLSPNAPDVNTKEQRLAGPVPVQVLHIEDVGRSAWSQVEAIESYERGETTKGREVVRVVPGDAGENGTTAATSESAKGSGPHKLLLQDANGLSIYGFEVAPVEGVGLTLSIGAKLLLRNATIARGVILLDPTSAQVLGGKVDAWDKSWRAGRKDALMAKVGARNQF